MEPTIYKYMNTSNKPKVVVQKYPPLKNAAALTPDDKPATAGKVKGALGDIECKKVGKSEPKGKCEKGLGDTGKTKFSEWIKERYNARIELDDEPTMPEETDCPACGKTNQPEQSFLGKLGNKHQHKCRYCGYIYAA